MHNVEKKLEKKLEGRLLQSQNQELFQHQSVVKVAIFSYFHNPPFVVMDKAMDDKFCTSQMIIHKISPSVDYNQWLKRFDTQLNDPTNKNLNQVPKVVKPTNKLTLS